MILDNCKLYCKHGTCFFGPLCMKNHYSKDKFNDITMSMTKTLWIYVFNILHVSIVDLRLMCAFRRINLFCSTVWCKWGVSYFTIIIMPFLFAVNLRTCARNLKRIFLKSRSQSSHLVFLSFIVSEEAKKCYKN